ncbi:hypothetical protein ES703_114798 [subsurface metagenome]
MTKEQKSNAKKVIENIDQLKEMTVQKVSKIAYSLVHQTHRPKGEAPTSRPQNAKPESDKPIDEPSEPQQTQPTSSDSSDDKTD